MFCGHCGKEIDQTDAVCKYCGKPCNNRKAVSQDNSPAGGVSHISDGLTGNGVQKDPHTSPRTDVKASNVQHSEAYEDDEYINNSLDDNEDKPKKTNPITSIIITLLSILIFAEAVFLTVLIIKDSRHDSGSIREKQADEQIVEDNEDDPSHPEQPAEEAFAIEEPAELTKTVHCDRCGKEIVLEKDSNITEDWIVFCGECGEEIDDEIGVR